MNPGTSSCARVPRAPAWCRCALRSTVLLIALTTGTLGAQVTVIDEGSFSLSVAGERIGREDFSIRSTRSAGAVSFVAQGTILRGERRVTVALNLDSAGTPLRLQSETREGAAVVENYFGRRERGIWSGRAVSESGESAREIRFPDGALVAEHQMVHHLWIVLNFGGGGSLVLIEPRTLTPQAVRLVAFGAEAVTLGSREFPAQRWELREELSGALLWEVWRDPTGRVLRARDATRDLEALRDEPPG